ncbi:hypothetical protein [Streptomyces sp. MB09-02B]|uniref:hypothetical protein n=1 Tax=Streptomyces sp. MB09-02B TaxID=3028667 RepID=UPI0029A75CA3|nr:hypothetical protein [Streptomyces sp. MB09-02B]MDX3640511.1 hypothetical protein [Streptomyces sp. MB09-02B]
MHVSGQLFDSAFETRIGGTPAGPDEVFPDWRPLDRFGLVVTEPLGGLGAALLLQLAIARFYAHRPERRDSSPVYPEIYLFHVGGPHGDFSNFDFWPPRKEVRVPAGQPRALLEAVNAHGITRLALPLGEPGEVGADSELGSGSSTWAEQASALERLLSCFLYSADGHVIDGDVQLSSTDPRVRENITATLDPVPGVLAVRAQASLGRPPAQAGPSAVADGLRWADMVDQRADEIPQPARERAVATHAARLHAQPDRFVEVYRRITADEALARIAGLR